MNRESLILKYLIVIILFILFIFCYKQGIFETLTSSFVKPTSNIYTVEVNRYGNYHSQIRSIVKQLFPKGSNVSDLEKFQVLHDFVKEYLSYNYDAIATASRSNDKTSISDANQVMDCFKLRTAVCGGYALMYEDLCEEAGLRCDYVSGKANFLSSKNIGHAWNAVYLNGKCYHVDVCWDDTGAGEYEFFMRGTNYININKAQFRTWTQNFPFSEEGILRNKIKDDIVLELIVK